MVEGQKALLAYPWIITHISLATRVLELPRIDEIMKAKRSFYIDLIRDASNPLAQLIRLAADIMEGLFPQDDQNDIYSIATTIEVEIQIEGTPTNKVGSFSAP